MCVWQVSGGLLVFGWKVAAAQSQSLVWMIG
jgi:hypothetical protein